MMLNLGWIIIYEDINVHHFGHGSIKTQIKWIFCVMDMWYTAYLNAFMTAVC